MKRILSTVLLLALIVCCLSFFACTKTEDSVTTYTVVFATHDGSTVPSQTVKEGEKVLKPQDPTRSGYTFDGWYLNDAKYNFDTPVYSDLRLVAGWVASSGTGSGDVEFPWVDVPTN